MSKKKKKKRKLNKKRVLMFFIILILVISFIYILFNQKIKNIYIKGNIYLTDQEIIDIAGLKDYPNFINNIPSIVKNRLNKSKYIISSNIKVKGFFNKIYIEIKENYPLFYDLNFDKLVLYDGTKVDDEKDSLLLINQVPNTIYDEFIKSMQKLDIDILRRMSEIKYEPNAYNDRFLITMNDGNYVYIRLKKFTKLNKYLDIVSVFEGKKGVLNLDSGEYFDLFDE